MNLKAFLKLPYKDKLFFCVNFIFSGLIRIVIKVVSYKTLSQYFGCYVGKKIVVPILKASKVTQTIRIKKVVALACRFTPWQSNCLVQAILAIFWCQRKGIPYSLFIGVVKDNSQKKIRSHAWVTSGSVAISGGYAFNTYHVIMCYVG
ncbi:MAG: lasso peptide biosynthesis B2 protein [Gammaproteobacteria bacterium]|nr:lasso peptide biosynthesis B2 protein [Gammaproteobacteria bacterium]